MSDDQACETPVVDLCASALQHYDEVSSAAHHWSNAIPKAIRYWYLERPKVDADLRQLAHWIGNRGQGLPDHACNECVPGGEIVVPGFVCGFHKAARIMESSNARSEARPVGTSRSTEELGSD